MLVFVLLILARSFKNFFQGIRTESEAHLVNFYSFQSLLKHYLLIDLGITFTIFLLHLEYISPMTLVIVYCNLLNLSFPLNCEQFKGKGQSFKILIPPPTHLPMLELRVPTGK